ncbi:ABC transporter permease [Planosporangium mesophilum]|uniref:Transport permease protein n=1 Tax=Planosporangium mesophilum TaxID=689768 RepID=A0A8J3X3W4_9ACTN|nr:ABC transporter permease [Planosporangium mesophilum]NJC86768.1 ABC transporter permease [Planosporangium mesophilum]GII26436.1 transport permease protein [Planosporangium mesophilum]
MSTLNLRWELADGATIVRRNLTYLRHAPGMLAVIVMAPVAMVVMFGYVFGSAIVVPGNANYREYLIPGLFGMVAVNLIPMMVTMARDVDQGFVDRYRTLPMGRAAVPFGMTGSQIVLGALSLALMALCGLAVGWRIHNGWGRALAGFGLLLLFQYAMSWVGVYLGLVVGREETASQLSALVFPVSMVSNAFVPTAGMPAWLRVVADWNPVSAVVAACRDLFGNLHAPVTADASWPVAHPIAATLAWSVGLLLVFVPLAVRRYHRTNR